MSALKVSVLSLFLIMALGAISSRFDHPALAAPSPQSGPASKTVWDRVYTEEQALRGEMHITMICNDCHDGNADGPEFNSGEFHDRWREDSLAPLFSYMKTKMPEEDPGSLKESEYLDILGYILWLNEFPSGTADLTLQALPDIQFIGKDGPRPLPLGSLVFSAGCLTASENNQWALTSATAPSRTRNMEPTEEGFKALETSAPGTNRVRLTGVAAAFNAGQHRGQKVYAKGLFSYENGAAGIDVMEMRALGPCGAPQQ